MTINEMVDKAYKNAKAHGFYDDFNKDKSNYSSEMSEHFIVAQLMMIVTEVCEAVNALRNGDQEEFRLEMADILLRPASLAGLLELDLDKAVAEKMAINEKREYKHGKSF